MIPIQTSIGGYGGKSATVYSAYDEDSQVLVVSVEAKFQKKRNKDCLVITNDMTIDRDMLFGDSEIKKAIKSFFNLQSNLAIDGESSRIVFSDKAGRTNPANVIESDGIDERGEKYRIAENVSCSQIAVLATCLYVADRFGVVDKVIEMMDEIVEIENEHYGLGFTI